MKVKNEYVEIKIGNKVFKKQNMILNTYLNKLIQAQIDENHDTVVLAPCNIKLDTPLENVDYDSLLYSRQDFDITLFASFKPTVIGSRNNIKVIYSFDDNSTFFYKKEDGTWTGTTSSNFNIFAGRKITAIGFGANITKPALAFLDTSNMNIIINKDENFKITRVDNISSEGTTEWMDYPLHLANDTAHRDEKTIFINDTGYLETTMAKLYSIGFGNNPKYMEEEYLVSELDPVIDDNSITFNLNRVKKVGHYPSENLQLGFYPTMDNSKYLIFKYRLYRRYKNDNDEYVTTYLDEYYIMSKPNENFGNLEIKLKIDRE